MLGRMYRISMLPNTCHVYFLDVMMASPNGRLAHRPASEGISRRRVQIANSVYNVKRMWIKDRERMAQIRKRMVFHGRVQGVGFRYTAKYLAQSLGLTGWVKNEYDGTVIMELQGREALINELMVGLNNNSFIHIEWIDSDVIPIELESCFYVR